jgi:cytochrome oxidase assembly protein ShyY1
MLRVVFSRRWLLRHLLVAVAVVTCLGFGRWQLGRAINRNSILNWSYAIEWGLFAAFAVLCWGWYLRDEIKHGRSERPETPARPVYLPTAQPVSDDEDPELAAYNRYLSTLNSKDTP